MTSAVVCPKCGSWQVSSRDYAKKACGAVGALAGASIALHKGKINPAESPFAAIIGAAGTLGDVLMGAFVGGAAGCASGAAVGSTIDDNILNNHECLACGAVFGKGRFAHP